MAERCLDERDVDDPRVADAVLTFLRAQDEGTPLDPEAWLSDYPHEIRSELRDIIDGLVLLCRPRSAVVLVPGNRPATPGRFPDFGRYRDLERIASGGMGAIYWGWTQR